jgi:hypothetical protein
MRDHVDPLAIPAKDSCVDLELAQRIDLTQEKAADSTKGNAVATLCFDCGLLEAILIASVEPSQTSPDHRTEGMCTGDIQVCKVLKFLSAMLRLT